MSRATQTERPAPGRLSRGVWAVAAFTGTYLAAAIPLALAAGNQEFLFYIVVMVGLIGAVALVHRGSG